MEAKKLKEEDQMVKKDFRPIWIYVIVTIVVSVLAGIIGTLLTNESEMSTTTTAIALVTANIITTIIFLLIYRKKIKSNILKFNKKHLIYVIVSTIVIISLNVLMYNIMKVLKIDMSNQSAIETYITVAKIPMIISVAFLAPFIEEMVFRYSLGTIIKNNTIFIIVSGILSGVAHATNISILLYIFIGMCLAYIYVKNDKYIIIPILVHILNNLFSLL